MAVSCTSNEPNSTCEQILDVRDVHRFLGLQKRTFGRIVYDFVGYLCLSLGSFGMFAKKLDGDLCL